MPHYEKIRLLPSISPNMNRMDNSIPAGLCHRLKPALGTLRW